MMRLRNLLRRRRIDLEIRGEAEAHIAERVDELVEGGTDAAEARRQAMRDFGNVAAVREEVHEANGIGHLETLWQDVRFALSHYGRSPIFFAVTVLTLSVGIGSSTAVFSVVDALLFRPLPYPESERLMAFDAEVSRPRSLYAWSYPQLETLRRRQTAFSSIAAYSPYDVTLQHSGIPENVAAEFVTANYFALFGVAPSLGRVFLSEEDETPGTHGVAVISHALWRDKFGSDPGVLGTTLPINSVPLIVVGVLPPRFRGQDGTTEIWIPTMMADAVRVATALSPGQFWLRVVGRLEDNVTETQARSELEAISTGILEEISPRYRDAIGLERLVLTPLRDTKVDPTVDRAFFSLFGAVLFVMAIACINTAGLLLSRSEWRRGELSLRLALGGARGRMCRQLVTEAMVLSMISGVVAVGVASAGVKWLTTAKPWNAIGFWSQYASTFDYFEVSLDGRVLLFNFVIAATVGLLTSLGPALYFIGTPSTTALSRGRGTALVGARPLRLRLVSSVLLVFQVGLSVSLVIGAGLLVRSFLRLTDVDLGFDPDRVLTMNMDVGSREVLPDVIPDLLSRLQRLPLVESANIAYQAPLSGALLNADAEIQNRSSATDSVRATHNIVAPEFFETFGISPRRGRLFTADDRSESPRVAIVNRKLVDTILPPDADPMDTTLNLVFRAHPDSPGDGSIRVVGVVDDVRYGAVEDSVDPTIYIPAAQSTIALNVLSVRTFGNPLSVVPTIRRELASVDNDIALTEIELMSDRVDRLLARFRYSASIMSGFASVALLITFGGIYGVMAYSVSRRYAEFGVRQALGASRERLLRTVLADGVVFITLGLVIGWVAAAAGGRFLTPELYLVEPNDVVTFAITAALVALVAALACLLPASRVLKLDLMATLRSE